jgi:hypothetical protein
MSFFGEIDHMVSSDGDHSHEVVASAATVNSRYLKGNSGGAQCVALFHRAACFFSPGRFSDS